MARIEKTIDVDVPVRVAYNQWTQLEEFPRFMEGVKEVQQIDDTHLHWKAEIAGREKEWTSEIVEQIPDRLISWRSTGGAKNDGSITFEPLPTGARVTLLMDYDPEGFLENVGDAFGATSRRMEADLRRFKEFVESRGRETGQWRGEVHQGQVEGAGTGAPRREAPVAASAPTPRLSTSDPSYWQGARDRRRAERRRSMTPAARHGLTRRRLGGPTFARDPLLSLRRLSQDMDELFEQLMGRPMLARRSLFAGGDFPEDALAPRTNVHQADGELRIDADLPGVRKEDVKLEFHDGQLTIEAERSAEESREAEGTYRSERECYSESIPLPEDADVDEATASLNDGVLKIVVPTPHRGRSRRIQIGGESEPKAVRAR